MMLLHGFLEDSAARSPDATALIDGPRRISYGNLDRLANRFANTFRDAGVRRHGRVLLALENSIELVAAYFAVLKIGGVAVPLPPSPKDDRLRKAVVDCTPAAAVVDAPIARDVEAARVLEPIGEVFVAGRKTRGQVLPRAFRLLEDAASTASEAPPPVRSIDVDLAGIIYTSGSTGEPRGVMLTHRNFVSNAHSIVSYLQLTASDRVMCVLPFHYVYGLSLLHTHVAVGGSLVLDNRFVFPNLVLRAIQEHAATGFAGVPSTFALLLHRSDLDATALPSLRYVTQAGGAMAAARIQEWLARGPQVPFYVMYGATEAAARLTYLDPSRLTEKLGSIGKAIPNVEILVVKEDGSIADPGETGELVARGSNVAAGYWNDTEETRKRFGPLGYRTGDLGYTDEDGYIYLVGRRHDMLKVGAHRVGAKEIEGVLSEFPGVSEVAVVGAPHALLGEVPVAFLAMRDGVDPDAEALHAYCRSRLPAHKIPAQFVRRTELPKLERVGKIDKSRLREQARASIAPVAH